MRIVLLLIISVFFMNCSSQKANKISKIIDGRKIKEIKVGKSLIVTIPKNWHKVYDHNYTGFSPLGSEGYYKNGVKIFYKDSDSIHVTLEDYVKNYTSKTNEHRNINIENQSISLDTTRYGKTFTHTMFTKSYGIDRMRISKFFEHNNRYYHFYNRSDVKYYKKYESDSELIFNNLKFLK